MVIFKLAFILILIKLKLFYGRLLLDVLGVGEDR